MSSVVTSIVKSAEESELIEKISPVLESLELKLRDVEVVKGQNALIRITLEKEASNENVGIEDCSKAHSILNPLFDVWDPLEGNYTLELSSPGEKAPLRTLEHFQGVLGEKVEFKTIEPLEMKGVAGAHPRRHWKGILEQVLKEEAAVILNYDSGTQKVLLSQMNYARVLRDWQSPQNKAK